MIYIGQTKIITELEIAIAISFKEKKVLPHILLYGERGYGKTFLATYIAEKIGSNITVANGGNISKMFVWKVLAEIGEGDVIFIDEIHSIPISTAEELYLPMQNFKMRIGSIDPFSLSIKKFTLIGATTEAGEIPKPLFDRFVYHFIMDTYSIEELADIIKLHSTKKIEKDLLQKIAFIAQGNPRTGINYLKRIENLSEGKIVKTKSLEKFIELSGIDEYGLIPLQRKYLTFLKTSAASVGKNVISNVLGLPESYIQNNIEPFLLKQGWISRTKTGRIITKKGLELQIK